MSSLVLTVLALATGCGRFGFAAHSTDGDAGPRVDVGPDPTGGRAGGLSYVGETLFEESFEDEGYGDRGWYDGANGTLGPPSPSDGSMTR